MTLRKLVFWLHLGVGLLAGGIIALLALTGIAIAFEHEILAYCDRAVARVVAPAAGEPKPLPELLAAVRGSHPDFHITTVLAPRDPAAAYTFLAGREHTLYVDPYTGAAAPPRSPGVHELLHHLTSLHRWLSFADRPPPVRRLMTGIANLLLVVLAVTGLWLWFPRRLAPRTLRPLLWFVPASGGRARDRNWHNVFGFWSLPVVLVLAGTGVVLSFGWAHDLVFHLAGEVAPNQRDARMLATPPPALPAPPAPGAEPLPLDTIHATLTQRHPRAEAFGFTLPPPGTPTRPLDVVVFESAAFSTRGRVQLRLDPWRGDVLSAVGWADRSPGLRARIWVRFLHTGEAFGLIGKITAVLGSIATIVLVWTGFTLSWHRFRRTRLNAAKVGDC